MARLPGRQSAASDDSLPRDDRGFGDWVRPHWAGMYALASRMAGAAAAEDILQDALVAAWRHRGTFDSRRGSARTWLLSIVANEARRAHGRSARTGRFSDDLPSAPAPQPEAVDLDRVIRMLPHRQRLAVVLRYYVGLSVAESAVVMRCSEGTVKSTLSDARRNLHALLGEDYR